MVQRKKRISSLKYRLFTRIGRLFYSLVLVQPLLITLRFYAVCMCDEISVNKYHYNTQCIEISMIVFESRNNIRYDDDYKKKNVGWKIRAGGGAGLWDFYGRVMHLCNLSHIAGYKEILCLRKMIENWWVWIRRNLLFECSVCLTIYNKYITK